MLEIVKWSEAFEDAYMRKLQFLKKFNHPSGCQSKGYRHLVREGPKGLAALGLFTALSQLMATMSIDIRKGGTFKNTDGTLMEIEDILELSHLDGMEVGEVWEMVGRLVGCGWVIVHKPLEKQNNASHLPPSSHLPPTSLPALANTPSPSPSPSITPSPSLYAPSGTSSDSEPKKEIIEWSAEIGFTGITDGDLSEWANAYPAVNLTMQIARAHTWLKDNPSKKKKAVRRFLSNWFSRSQERGGDISSNKPGQIFAAQLPTDAPDIP